MLSLELSRQNESGPSGSVAAPLAERFFSSCDHLIRIVKDAVASRHTVRITLPGKGDVVVVPDRDAYHANVTDADMQDFCRAPADQFRVSRVSSGETAALPASSGSISDLLWMAGFHASQGRLVQSRSTSEAVHEYDVIRITHWPNLSRLPTTPNTMRIFALLVRRPSAIMLIHRKLRIEPEEVFQIYSAACTAGYISVVSQHFARPELDEVAQTQPHQERSILGALFAKLSRL